MCEFLRLRSLFYSLCSRLEVLFFRGLSTPAKRTKISWGQPHHCPNQKMPVLVLTKIAGRLGPGKFFFQA